MGDININLTKWYHLVLAVVPIFAFILTALMWVDTRYMHKEISDTRFIELQMRIVDGRVDFYNRLIDDGVTLSAQDSMKYEMEKDQLKKLIVERNKILKIGNLPE